MTRILVVEPDKTTSRSLEMMLAQANMPTFPTDMGEDAIDLARLYDYDLILLELGLPDMSGYDVLKRLRQARIDTPVIVLTGIDSTDSKIKALTAGADDYLTKPFHREELIARIQAVLRRSQGRASDTITIGEITIDLQAKRVTVNDTKVHLTSKEYLVMELLAVRQGILLTKEQLLDHLYAGRDEPELKIIDVFVCKIRKKLLSAGSQIMTVWGRGFTLNAS